MPDKKKSKKVVEESSTSEEEMQEEVHDEESSSEESSSSKQEKGRKKKKKSYDEPIRKETIYDSDSDSDSTTSSSEVLKEHVRVSAETEEEHDKALAPILDESGEGGKKKKKMSIEEYCEKLECTLDGLTSEEGTLRLNTIGPNSLPTKSENPVLKFLSYMWNPLSWLMEIAAIVSIVLIDYVDFILIIVLLLINSTIAFWEEYSSGNAVAALQKSLQPETACYRDGKLDKEFPAVNLVPGDVLILQIGDVVPADCILLEKSLKIDQSSLTGETIPVSKFPGEECLSGSVVKQGQGKCLVYATGIDTFYGKAASLIQESGEIGHFQQVLRAVGWFCMVFIAIMVAIELGYQFGKRKMPCVGVGPGKCDTIENAIVLIVGGVPIAMPTVLSVMMAIGASFLAAKNAIVVRLTSVEELAGMNVLCSDKTGTLTLNQLTVKKPIALSDVAPEDVIYFSALAAPPDNSDVIDTTMVKACTDAQREAIKNDYEMLFFHPFDPESKKTYTKLKHKKTGKVQHYCKGAPQVVLKESSNRAELAERVNAYVLKLAQHGYRTLGVSVSDSKGKDWKMVGLIPLYDPPRHDTKETIEKCADLGIDVKMITGDQLAIAKETARLLGMAPNIYPAEALSMSPKKLAKKYNMDETEIVLKASGFAQVMPEDKFSIVKNLQEQKLVVGMTGDGVNDAPALKRSDIGIAVADATDAARAAADIVLVSPGLGVIVDAIVESRKIFQRMKNYCIYSIAACIRIVLTFGLLTLIYNWYFPTIAIVFLAVLNDGSMMTLSKDRARASKIPDTWNLKEIFIIATLIGLYLTLSTHILFYVAHETTWFHDTFGLAQLNVHTIRGLIYLQVSVSGLAAIFVTRSQGFSYFERPALLVVIGFILCQIVASVLGAYGLNGFKDFHGSGWGYVLVAWIWCVIWYVPLDFIKFFGRQASSFKIILVRSTEKRVLNYGFNYHGGGDNAKFSNMRKSLEGRFSISID